MLSLLVFLQLFAIITQIPFPWIIWSGKKNLRDYFLQYLVCSLRSQEGPGKGRGGSIKLQVPQPDLTFCEGKKKSLSFAVLQVVCRLDCLGVIREESKSTEAALVVH